MYAACLQTLSISCHQSCQYFPGGRRLSISGDLTDSRPDHTQTDEPNYIYVSQPTVKRRLARSDADAPIYYLVRRSRPESRQLWYARQVLMRGSGPVYGQLLLPLLPLLAASIRGCELSLAGLSGISLQDEPPAVGALASWPFDGLPQLAPSSDDRYWNEAP